MMIGLVLIGEWVQWKRDGVWKADRGRRYVNDDSLSVGRGVGKVEARWRSLVESDCNSEKQR